MKKTFLVALHAHNINHGFYEASKIFEAGARGVIISDNGKGMSGNSEDILDIYFLAKSLKEKFSDKLIGVNPVNPVPERAINQTRNHAAVDFLFSPDGGMRERVIKEDKEKGIEAKYLLSIKPEIENALNGFEKQYFGGVGIKNQGKVIHLNLVAAEAAKYFSTIVTSDEYPNKFADIEKLHIIKKAIGNTPLALADGFTIENVHEYFKDVTTFIVDTQVWFTPNNMFVYDERKIEAFTKVFS